MTDSAADKEAPMNHLPGSSITFRTCLHTL